MQAMVLNKLGTALPNRQPEPGEIRGQVAACGARRTDLHAIDRELRGPEAIGLSSACINDAPAAARDPPLRATPRATQSFVGLT
jgi:hypothetical protein